MNKIFGVGIALALTTMLAGCGQQNVKDLLGNLERDCDRHYAGSLGSGVPPQGTVTFTIDCKPLPQPLAPSAVIAPVK